MLLEHITVNVYTYIYLVYKGIHCDTTGKT